MTLPRSSNVIDVATRIPYGEPPVFALGDVAPGKVLDIIPVPDTGQYMMIVAHLVSADEAKAVKAERPQASDGLGGLVLDRDARRVWAEGDEVALTFQEYELLAYLTEKPGTVFTRIHLMNVLWPGSTRATPRTVDVHVHRLRRKLRGHGASLVTVRRVGYAYRPARSGR
ncbi:winged helix-turn-helix domain-containing protein [Actinomadura sp. DC4]|uniref:winged helix-turn-helix domain-containing protein n=1 Tax=Actinomadura sp. DC4 TaxID=3055069 RepID=UPI0025AF31AE|nr:winged helix-turn-helix domain-containing protein [Actinomadura sp. DC4]MDN3351817.1 winged helix-turn-helix domain-containing protein [Actinomadura sp. DC4]